MVDRTGKLVGENSSNAQIRTLLEEKRQIIIAGLVPNIHSVRGRLKFRTL